jgi:hypothetical protein
MLSTQLKETAEFHKKSGWLFWLKTRAKMRKKCRTMAKTSTKAKKTETNMEITDTPNQNKDEIR